MLSSNSSFKTLPAYIKNAMHTEMHYIEPKQLLIRDPSKCPQIDHLLFALSQKNQNRREYLPLSGFSVTMPLLRKVPDVTKKQI